MKTRIAACGALLALILGSHSLSAPVSAQSRKAVPQKNDEEYTRLIKEYLQDPRITTELVDHLPASDTVPSPLKFLGRARRHAGRADLRQGHPSLLRGAGARPRRAREVLEDRHDRRRPRHRRCSRSPTKRRSSRSTSTATCSAR